MDIKNLLEEKSKKSIKEEILEKKEELKIISLNETILVKPLKESEESEKIN